MRKVVGVGIGSEIGSPGAAQYCWEGSTILIRNLASPMRDSIPLITKYWLAGYMPGTDFENRTIYTAVSSVLPTSVGGAQMPSSSGLVTGPLIAHRIDTLSELTSPDACSSGTLNGGIAGIGVLLAPICEGGAWRISARLQNRATKFDPEFPPSISATGAVLCWFQAFQLSPPTIMMVNTNREPKINTQNVVDPYSRIRPSLSYNDGDIKDGWNSLPNVDAAM
ncbi:hypothetical protein BV22DRAFT_1121609 [Leucogyrophana mollusca]|uniref:Uncharacterized protein n=1 Tax=Leucogyrophana mollusca TaxID=85980 RepID=A0ACB8B8V2_9AGAM|nr:hypothetical protein BV22DRAFT_1121609 [Leucogyrophana mollusca]